MSTNVITPTSSIEVTGATEGLVLSADSSNTLLIIEHAYIVSADGNAVHVSNNDGTFDATIYGTIASGGNGGLILEGAGVFDVRIGSTGVVSAMMVNAGIRSAAAAAEFQLDNAGLISGSTALDLHGTQNDIVNSGKIQGFNDFAIKIVATTGSHILTNSGTISASNGMTIQGSDGGTDSVFNTGTIMGGVFLRDGADVLYNSGVIAGTVNLGLGDDIFIGGPSSFDFVEGGLGDDTIRLGGDDDVFFASGGLDGNDELRGGDGTDTYDASMALSAIIIDLADRTAFGGDIGSDVVIGFENVVGTFFGSDNIFGNALDNRLDGGGAADFLGGAGGDDRLIGGLGGDVLRGGLGKDVMSGGIQGDTYLFASIMESGVTGDRRDVITDFKVDGADKINVSAIDAKTTVAGNNVFIWIGAAAFTSVAGQFHVQTVGTNKVASGDVNGDALADFAILLWGTPAVVMGDFVL